MTTTLWIVAIVAVVLGIFLGYRATSSEAHHLDDLHITGRREEEDKDTTE